jgi:hypothetical protein
VCVCLLRNKGLGAELVRELVSGWASRLRSASAGGFAMDYLVD